MLIREAGLLNKDQVLKFLENKKRRLERMAERPGSRQQERILKQKIAEVAKDIESYKKLHKHV